MNYFIIWEPLFYLYSDIYWNEIFYRFIYMRIWEMVIILYIFVKKREFFCIEYCIMKLFSIVELDSVFISIKCIHIYDCENKYLIIQAIDFAYFFFIWLKKRHYFSWSNFCIRTHNIINYNIKCDNHNHFFLNWNNKCLIVILIYTIFILIP